MSSKKPPAPSVSKPKDRLDPNRWKEAALRAVCGPTTIRHKRLMQLYALGAMPEQAAAEARTHHANSQRTGLSRKRR